MARRDFVKLALVATGALALNSVEAASKPKNSPLGLIDVNVNLARWPLRRLRFDNTAALVAKFRSHGVAQAWAGSFDSLLH